MLTAMIETMKMSLRQVADLQLLRQHGKPPRNKGDERGRRTGGAGLF
jgi:hypothetical protein